MKAPPPPPDDDDPAVDWPEEDAATKIARTQIDPMPLALTTEDTPTRPVELFAGYDAGKADGMREGRLAGIYEVIQETRALLVAGKNAPEFIETYTEFITRRCRVRWPPPKT